LGKKKDAEKDGISNDPRNWLVIHCHDEGPENRLEC